MMCTSLLWIVENEADTSSFIGSFDEDSFALTLTTAKPIADRLRHVSFDVVLVTVPLVTLSMDSLARELSKLPQLVPVVLHDPHGSLAAGSQWQRRIPNCQITSTQSAPRLAELVSVASLGERQRMNTPSETVSEPWRKLLVGESQPIRQILEVIRLVARRQCTVLLTGETGTGKEVVARAIHAASNRASSPMVAINCAALPANLLEAELFGHTKGAFTGAVSPRIGRFEQAHRGTLFLDEIGELPLELQVKLLRFLQEREIQRIGSSESIQLDVRVIAATNSDLLAAMERGTFRKDLYYRLNVVPVHVPPLRERAEDIPLLVDHFIEKTCAREALPLKRVSPDVTAELSAHSWGGNVRELEHAVERAVVLSGDRRTLYPFDFALAVDTAAPSMGGATVIRIPEGGINFEETMVRIERTLLGQALQKSNGNKAKAAGMLGMKRTTLLSKIKTFDFCTA